MTINPAYLFNAYSQARDVLGAEAHTLEGFLPVARKFEEKLQRADAVIMVYGVYNAGKSTLINALLGAAAAPMGDIPLTASVSAYRWGTYDILDTPGVDAPIAHETITREQMLTADAVIFVVDPIGTVEEAKTLQILLELIAAGKQVFLVLNEKKPLPDADFLALKDQIRVRLQDMAAASRLTEVLQHIPIVRVNARRALQGRLEKQAVLVERSGFPAFEQQLQTFLQGITPATIYANLQKELLAFIDAHIDALSVTAQSSAGKTYDKLLGTVTVEKARLEQVMQRELNRHGQHIYDRTRSSLRSGAEESQRQIEQALRESAEQLCATLQYELQALMVLVEDKVDAVQAALPELTAPQAAVDISGLATDDADTVSATILAQNTGPTLDMLKDAAQHLGGMAKPEHIVGGLKIVKQSLPALMKGIGIKTMEKWAANLVTKWIPYVGAGYAACEALYSLFKGDPEEQQLRAQAEAQARERERAQQQVDDIARDIADSFKEVMRKQVVAETASFFDNVTQQVETLRSAFNQAEQAQSRHLERLLVIRQLAADA